MRFYSLAAVIAVSALTEGAAADGATFGPKTVQDLYDAISDVQGILKDGIEGVGLDVGDWDYNSLPEVNNLRAEAEKVCKKDSNGRLLNRFKEFVPYDQITASSSLEENGGEIADYLLTDKETGCGTFGTCKWNVMH